MTKEEIRKDKRKTRAAIPSDVRSVLDLQIFERAHKHRAFQLAQRIFLYHSMSGEVDTTPFIEYGWGTGKEVFVPVVVSESCIEFVLITPSTTWAVSEQGIMEPANGDLQIRADAIVSNDCIVVPVVAFDRQCNRLGQGGGYYDRFLSAVEATSIGIAYECQRFQMIPTETHDVTLNAIATEERWYAV